jgi:hypothetical protein
MDYTDKRRHKRVFFSKGDQVTGEIHRPGAGDGSFSAVVLDISESGIGVTLSREKMVSDLQVGDRLILKSIQGIPAIESDEYIEMEVRWVLNVSFLDHIGFGCKFKVIPDSARDRIRLIVEVAQ